MKSNSILFIITALIIAAGVFWYFSTQTGNQPSLTASTNALENRAQTQFATLVSELQPISFDTTIFSEANFMALVDLTTPITPEVSGRPDPFAPIPGVIGK